MDRKNELRYTRQTKYRYALIFLLGLLFQTHFSGDVRANEMSNRINADTDNFTSVEILMDESSKEDTCTQNFTIYYPIDGWKILPEYAGNDSTLHALKQFIEQCNANDKLKIKRILLTGSCSVDGPSLFNNQLAKKRCNSSLHYLQQNFPQISNQSIDVKIIGENWSEFSSLIEASSMVGKQQVLNVINENSSEDLRTQQLTTNEAAFGYLQKHIFPQLRYSNIAIHYATTVDTPAPTTQTPIVEEVIVEEPVYVEQIVETPVEYEVKPLFALKTNLLLDAVTALNVEIEVPIKKRWSIAGEYIFPWWRRDRDRESIKPSRLQVLYGTLEGRYWFGNREVRPVLNGWFLGVYGGGGIYDVEWKGKGYQGNYIAGGGISAGYSHKIGRNLSLEYSLGVGYMRTHYKHYNSLYGADCKWHAIEENSGYYNWIGPTRAKISLVWLLHYKTKKGGRL